MTSSKEVLVSAIGLMARHFGDQSTMKVVCVSGHRTDATIASIRLRSVTCQACGGTIRAYAVDKE